jgi:hypothetical protein
MADSVIIRHQNAVMRGDYQAVVFLLTDVFAEVNRSEASFVPPGTSSTVFLNGVLTLVEKVKLFTFFLSIIVFLFLG